MPIHIFLPCTCIVERRHDNWGNRWIHSWFTSNSRIILPFCSSYRPLVLPGTLCWRGLEGSGSRVSVFGG